jgi:hypothetical protein
VLGFLASNQRACGRSTKIHQHDTRLGLGFPSSLGVTVEQDQVRSVSGGSLDVTEQLASPCGPACGV